MSEMFVIFFITKIWNKCPSVSPCLPYASFIFRKDLASDWLVIRIG